MRLTVDGKSWTQPIVVEPHPAGYATAADLKAQHELLRGDPRPADRDARHDPGDPRRARGRSSDIGERAAARLGKGDALTKQAAAITAKLDAVEGELTNPQIIADEDDLNYEPKLDHDWVYLAGIVGSADAKPLASSVEYYRILASRLSAARSEFQAILDGDVKAFNQAVAAAGVPPVAAVPPSRAAS